jgi:hypothetical protein
VILASFSFEIRFEHARLVLLQYKVCGPKNSTGTVDIPIALDALYGYVFGKIQAKHLAFRLPRVNIVSDISDAAAVEKSIADMRAAAGLADLLLPFPLSLELTSNTLNSYDVDYISNRSSIVNASMTVSDPLSDADCNAGDFSGTWTWNDLPSLDYPRKRCCAQSCTGLLDTVGTAPSAMTSAVCCSACNLQECSPADDGGYSIIKASSLKVPSLQNGLLTTVSFNI